MVILPILLIALLVLFSLPPANGEGAGKQFVINLPKAFFGILLPLFVFFASALVAPPSKSTSAHGWLDSFHVGKLALTPLVLWGTAALYLIEIRKQPQRPWVVCGLLAGTIASVGCLVFGILIDYDSIYRPWLIVPLYTAIWYLIRFGQQAKSLSLKGAMGTFIGSALLWIESILWAHRHFDSLPETPPSCFVVTAAARGHARIVGPFHRIPRRDHIRVANQQLITLWQFEALWQRLMPRSHGRFRRVYNRFGPRLARRIQSRVTADIAYLILKPAELLAWLTLALAAFAQRMFSRIV